MDGTLITSIEAADRVWTRWAARHGLDARAFLSSIHGQRAVDTIRQLKIPGVVPETEAALLTQMEIDDVGGVRAIAGARKFVDSLPQSRWAIVTSAPRALATVRLKAAGLRLPGVLVTADDIVVGKPDPSGYRQAARKLGVDAADCAIFEDADVGIRAGEGAGGQVIVITATHAHPLATQHPAFHSFDEIEPQISRGQIALVDSRPHPAAAER
jgi:mannitol-1-/sugar-/sorbitol-6-phosphatase